MPTGARRIRAAARSGAALALALALAACATVEDSLALGNIPEAEQAAARAKDDERRGAYLQLAADAVAREDYPAAIRAYSAIDDYQSLFALGKALETRVREGSVAGEAREAAITGALLAFRRAALFSKRYIDKYKGLWLTTEKGIGPHGMAFAVWLGLQEPKYFGAVESIAASAGIPPAEYGEAIGKLIWECYLGDPGKYRGCLPAARKYFAMSPRGASWIKQIDFSAGDELAWQGRYAEAVGAYKALGAGEAEAASRIGYCILSPRGRDSTDAAALREAIAWFDRAGDGAGRQKAQLALCDACLRLGQTAAAEEAFLAAGGQDRARAAELAAAWLGAGQRERSAAMFVLAGRQDEAERLWLELAEERFAAGDYPATLSFLERSGKPDRQIRNYLEPIARWREGRGEDEAAAALYARAQDFEKARAAYRRLMAAALSAGDYPAALAAGEAYSRASIVAEPWRPPSLAKAAEGDPAGGGAKAGPGSRIDSLNACVETIAEAELWDALPGFVAFAGEEGLRACRDVAAWLSYRRNQRASQRLLAAIQALPK